MYQLEVFDAFARAWRPVCVSDEGEEGLMFAYDAHSPERRAGLEEASRLARLLSDELSVRVGVRQAGQARLAAEFRAVAPVARPCALAA